MNTYIFLHTTPRLIRFNGLVLQVVTVGINTTKWHQREKGMLINGEGGFKGQILQWAIFSSKFFQSFCLIVCPMICIGSYMFTWLFLVRIFTHLIHQSHTLYIPSYLWVSLRGLFCTCLVVHHQVRSLTWKSALCLEYSLIICISIESLYIQINVLVYLSFS